MIRLDSVIETMGIDSDGKRVLKVSLEADTAAEVIENGTQTDDVVGMAPNTKIGAFSDCFTAEKRLGILDSSSNWNFD